MRFKRLFAFLMAIFAGCGIAHADDFVIERSFLRTRIDNRAVRLEALIVKRSDLTDKLPIALITHGKPAELSDMLDAKAEALAGQARDLAKRGWLAVVVMRRGFGQSDGPMAAPVSCATTSFTERLGADADDLQAALHVIGQRADADPERVIAIGASAGGAAVVAFAARNPKNLRGVISVSGGLRMPNCPKEDVLVNAYKEYGAASRVPSIWLYARNDSFFGPDLVARMHAAFLDGGGDVKLVQFDKIGDDGHSMFASASGRLRWLMEMDSFLRFHKLPATRRDGVADLMKLLKFDAKQRGFLETYLAAPTYKAMAQTADGKLSIQYGSSNDAAARKIVLDGCKERHKSAEPCRLIMGNDTWLGAESSGGGAQP
jgi:dienelactone hydrolase